MGGGPPGAREHNLAGTPQLGESFDCLARALANAVSQQNRTSQGIASGNQDSGCSQPVRLFDQRGKSTDAQFGKKRGLPRPNPPGVAKAYTAAPRRPAALRRVQCTQAS